eukprot:2008279-Rhodomonas_salina.1
MGILRRDGYFNTDKGDRDYGSVHRPSELMWGHCHVASEQGKLENVNNSTPGNSNANTSSSTSSSSTGPRV